MLLYQTVALVRSHFFLQFILSLVWIPTLRVNEVKKNVCGRFMFVFRVEPLHCGTHCNGNTLFYPQKIMASAQTGKKEQVVSKAVNVEPIIMCDLTLQWVSPLHSGPAVILSSSVQGEGGERDKDTTNSV